MLPTDEIVTEMLNFLSKSAEECLKNRLIFNKRSREVKKFVEDS